MKQHEQKWLGFNRRLIITDQFEGSVQLELYSEPRGGANVTAYICGLWVEPQHRGKGHAARLMAEAERVAAENGHKAVFLDWDKREAEQWTFDWYLRRGYNEVEFGRYNSLLKKRL